MLPSNTAGAVEGLLIFEHLLQRIERHFRRPVNRAGPGLHKTPRFVGVENDVAHASRRAPFFPPARGRLLWRILQQVLFELKLLDKPLAALAIPTHDLPWKLGLIGLHNRHLALVHIRARNNHGLANRICLSRSWRTHAQAENRCQHNGRIANY